MPPEKRCFMLKINLKIFLVHILCCGLCYWSFWWDWIDAYPVSLSIFGMFVVFSYIVAGFWANNGKGTGAWPVVSVFGLGLVLILVSIPVMIYGSNWINVGFIDVLFFLPNIFFLRFLFTSNISLNIIWGVCLNYIHTNILFCILALLPSTLAMIGYFLREPLHRKKRKAAQVEDLDLT